MFSFPKILHFLPSSPRVAEKFASQMTKTTTDLLYLSASIFYSVRLFYEYHVNQYYLSHGWVIGFSCEDGG